MRPAPWTRPGARPCACISRAAASPACATCSIARWGCPGPPRARRHPRRGPPPRLARMLGARQREIDRLRTAADARGTLAELLGAPGLEVLRLAAVAPFRDVRGHLLWDPAHDTVLLYAAGLPPLPAASTYQVRLGFDDGREQAGPSFRPDGRGALALSVGLGRAAEQLRAVRVLLEPGAEPVLAGTRPR